MTAAAASDAQAGLSPRALWLLGALAAAPQGAATPAELIEAHPEQWAGVPVRSATSSLHLTGAHLLRLGLVRRGRRQIDRHGTGQLSGGPVLYRLTATGRLAAP
jgi:hypothetical protein